MVVPVRMIRLEADSNRQAFYELRLMDHGEKFVLEKTSGACGKILDTRTWEFATFPMANTAFSRKVRTKTNPGRKSPRVYRVVGTGRA